MKHLKVLKTIQVKKEDFSKLEEFLQKNDLIDDKEIWFGGFDDERRSTQNAVAANLLYGNKRLIIVCINKENVYYLHNSKEGFNVYLLGTVDEKFHVVSIRNIVYPSVEIDCPRDYHLMIKVTKNKAMIKDFKKTVK